MENETMRIVTIEDLCEQPMVGKSAAYGLLRTGKIKGFRIKRIWKIPQIGSLRPVNTKKRVSSLRLVLSLFLCQ